jgi:hypothetical protein
MNFIGKHLSLIGILLLTIFVGAAAGLYFDEPGRLGVGTSERKERGVSGCKHDGTTARTHASDGRRSASYTCPMHADVVQDHPGDYPKCGMALVPAGQSKSAHDQCAHSGHGQNQSGCCADKSAAHATTEMKLPPGHPPVPGWTIEGSPENEPASANTAPHSSH